MTSLPPATSRPWEDNPSAGTSLPNTWSLVKLRMLKLSSHFIGQASLCPPSSYCTRILRAYISMILPESRCSRHSRLGDELTCPPRFEFIAEKRARKCRNAVTNSRVESSCDTELRHSSQHVRTRSHHPKEVAIAVKLRNVEIACKVVVKGKRPVILKYARGKCQ